MAETSEVAVARPSVLRAWFYLVWLSWARQARVRQMLGIAVMLLLCVLAVVLLNTARDAWSMRHWRWPFRAGHTFTDTTAEYLALENVLYGKAGAPAAAGFVGACGGLLSESGFLVFSRYIVFTVFVSFLLPVLSLSFATDALGTEREGNTMIWLLTRPLPRPAIYLGKFAALLPWSLSLTVGGFAIVCLAAGRPGQLALELFWPAVVLSTLAFSSLFHFMAACFRRPAVIGLVYAFFLEVLLGNLPGYLKRISIGFYTRCMMFDVAEDFGLQAEKPSIYLPVNGTTAAIVLLSITVVMLVLGTIVFTRSQYHEVE
jgi:ABC-type transport system involved in multi-copper enzyme maturation permease subunit